MTGSLVHCAISNVLKSEDPKIGVNEVDRRPISSSVSFWKV